jgi:hypothetical protein
VSAERAGLTSRTMNKGATRAPFFLQSCVSQLRKVVEQELGGSTIRRFSAFGRGLRRVDRSLQFIPRHGVVLEHAVELGRGEVAPFGCGGLQQATQQRSAEPPQAPTADLVERVAAALYEASCEVGQREHLVPHAERFQTLARAAIAATKEPL